MDDVPFGKLIVTEIPESAGMEMLYQSWESHASEIQPSRVWLELLIIVAVDGESPESEPVPASFWGGP